MAPTPTDPTRLAVPNASVVLAGGRSPDRDTALSTLRFVRGRLAPYKRIRRLEFADPPKTISGKIRRVGLRGRETSPHGDGGVGSDAELRGEEFPEIGG